MRTVAEEYDRVVGVDTHTMTLLTATGGVVEHLTFPSSAAGLHRADLSGRRRRHRFLRGAAD